LQVSGVALDGRPLRRELLRQAFATSLPELLRYADRHSMAHGREVRLPFLDRRVAEFALSAPAELLHWGGQRKQLLRDAARGIVPDPIIERRDKIGFEPPQARWLTAGRARSWIADVLLDPSARTRGLYDSAALAADLRAGAWRDHDALWRALNAELWLGSSAVAEGLAA
jgi:asparagine synthase (glutamine-hydrolysing)